MKKLLCIAILAAALTAGVPASAQQAAPPPHQSGSQGQGGGEGGGDRFEERKAKILEHLGNALARMQETQKCVQAAKDADALRGCKPQRPGPGPGGDRGGDDDHGGDDRDDGPPGGGR